MWVVHAIWWWRIHRGGVEIEETTIHSTGQPATFRGCSVGQAPAPFAYNMHWRNDLTALQRCRLFDSRLLHRACRQYWAGCIVKERKLSRGSIVKQKKQWVVRVEKNGYTPSIVWCKWVAYDSIDFPGHGWCTSACIARQRRKDDLTGCAAFSARYLFLHTIDEAWGGSGMRWRGSMRWSIYLVAWQWVARPTARPINFRVVQCYAVRCVIGRGRTGFVLWISTKPHSY
jgi:hypothetical protein